ncbi:MAG: ABC transporter ATP-binding protein [Betaproteobacteria bacterium]|nr:ABC transporter ATP-binding protein [Betaproteobacteria bacterium]
MEIILKVDQVSKHFGGFTALNAVSLELKRGERLGLIGPNGSGKTTLINCISGALVNESGQIVFRGKSIGSLPAYQRTRLGIARSFQIPRPFRSMTVMENLLVPLSYVGGLSGKTADARAEEILSGMGLASKMDQGCNQLSQVELRKLELSDEAMAGLAGTEIDEVLAILHSLNRKGITIIMIEHIMQAVMSFSERVVCLDAGQIICEGTPAEVVANPFVQRAYLGD